MSIAGAITGGDTYNFDVWAELGANSNGNGTIGTGALGQYFVQWFKSDNTFLGQTIGTFFPTSTYQQYSSNGLVAPVGASKVQVQLVAAAGAVAGQGITIEFDDASLVDASTPSVPEPASLALLGVGGLALLRRRRKA